MNNEYGKLQDVSAGKLYVIMKRLLVDNEYGKLLTVSAGKLHVCSDYEKLLVDNEYGKLLVVSAGIRKMSKLFQLTRKMSTLKNT